MIQIYITWLCSTVHEYSRATHSGWENVIRTASKQKALANAAIIKPDIGLLLSCKHNNNIRIDWLCAGCTWMHTQTEDTYCLELQPSSASFSYTKCSHTLPLKVVEKNDKCGGHVGKDQQQGGHSLEENQRLSVSSTFSRHTHKITFTLPSWWFWKNNIQWLSRPSSSKFQQFKGSIWFSRTFQVLENGNYSLRTFKTCCHLATIHLQLALNQIGRHVLDN